MSKSSKKSKAKGKSIEEKYQKKTQHEHILDLPDTYIGSIEEKTCSMWIFNSTAKEKEAKIINKEITYVPGFYKICDEIFVNAADHTKRNKENKIPCTIIKVNIDQKSGRITVWNNGDGIDVAVHKEHKILVPSMVFGQLLSSSNYDKNEKKTVGGKNGFGAKLTNIYSTEFVVETLDAKTDQKFYQKFTKNMYNMEKAKISSGKGKKPYTKISFIADFEKFGLKGITNDMLALLKKRVYDLAMTTTAKVYLDDAMISQNNFTKYIDLYFPDGSERQTVIDISNKRWKVCAVYDQTDQLEHQNISFVNSICTNRGGTHVDHVVNQVVNKLKEVLAKKLKGTQVKPTMIKENLIFFVDATIVNPDFDTQTKEALTTKPPKFGSQYVMTDKFIKGIIKTGVVDQIIANAQAKAEAALGKNGRRKPRYEKLYEAHWAGTKRGSECTLILMEGDSAKTFAMSGLNVVGRERFGVFPLRGKLLNVRDAAPGKIAKNEEIEAIIAIMGLEPKKVYNDLAGLRYGSIMILADQDVDGYHIKGLIMNFIHYFWPSLVKYEGFIQSFATPLLKATKGSGKNKKVIEFTSPQTYEKWKEENNGGKGWVIKYYKGLGTSTAAEAQECFTDLEKKLVKYYWESKVSQPKSDEKKSSKEKSDKKKSSENKHKSDEKKYKSDEKLSENSIVKYKPKKKDICEDAITLAFEKKEKREDDRKVWVNMYNPDDYIDSSKKRISYHEFIHKELITFSVYDNQRSIPSIMDGFKPSQRKVFKGSVDEGIYKEEIKVAELAAAVSKRTKYHHGPQSLEETIVNMAQNYVGSNNVNLLMPIGQFGTRLSGGKDAASSRYIFTKLDALAKKIFVDDDYDILERQYEDNKEIEPTFYAPIMPMILINGTSGIGTGYSTSIEPFNPRDIYANIKRILAGDKPKAMKPWYRHFTGSIEKIETNKFVSRAKYEVLDDSRIHVTDLPIGVWTDNYKAFLDNLLAQGATQKAEAKKVEKAKATKTKGKATKTKGGSKKNSKFLAKKSKKSATAKVAKQNPVANAIKTYTEDCTEIRINFTITFHPGKLKTLIKNGQLEKGLKLVTPLNLTNMHLFDETGKIRKYETAGAILKNFARVRLELYQKRKDYLLGKWKKEIDILKWKMKFIEHVRDGKIIVFKEGESKTTSEVIGQLEELKFPKFITGGEKNATYSYITTTGLFKLTKDEIEKLRKELEEKKEEIANLEGRTSAQMWESELDEFMEAYDKWEAECDAAYDDLITKKKGAAITKKKRAAKKQMEVEV